MTIFTILSEYCSLQMSNLMLTLLQNMHYLSIKLFSIQIVSFENKNNSLQ